MASLKGIIYTLGTNNTKLNSAELAILLYGKENIIRDTKRVGELLYKYKRFFISERGVDSCHRKQYTLSKSGRRFFENIKYTYDPTTDTQVLPQSQDKYKNEYKVPEGYKLVKIEE